MNRHTRFFVFLLAFTFCLAGCSESEPIDPSTQIIQGQLDAVPYSKDIASAITETNERKKYATLWPFTKSRANLVYHEPAHAAGGTSIYCQLSLAESATDWSTGTVSREVSEDNDPSTAIASLGNFMAGIWFPTSIFSPRYPTESGESDLLVWETTNRSTPKLQMYEVRFKLKKPN